MTWQQKLIAEDPDWKEWHKQVMTPSRGRAMLKVWLSHHGFMASVVCPNGLRSVTSLQAETDDEAKKQALDWALQPPTDKEGE